MLPVDLHGPGLTIAYAREQAAEFLQLNAARYPHPDRDFILQICFEHPDRLDRLLPRFDVETHIAVRVRKQAYWIDANIRYDHDAVVDFLCDQIRAVLSRDDKKHEGLAAMRPSRSSPTTSWIWSHSAWVRWSALRRSLAV